MNQKKSVLIKDSHKQLTSQALEGTPPCGYIDCELSNPIAD